MESGFSEDGSHHGGTAFATAGGTSAASAAAVAAVARDLQTLKPIPEDAIRPSLDISRHDSGSRGHDEVVLQSILALTCGSCRDWLENVDLLRLVVWIKGRYCISSGTHRHLLSSICVQKYKDRSMVLYVALNFRLLCANT